LCPLCAFGVDFSEFFNDLLVYGKGTVMGQQGQKIGNRVVPGNLERVFDQRCCPDPTEISDFAFVISFRIFNAIQLIGILGSQTRRQQALPGVNKVMGGKGISVGPDLRAFSRILKV